MRTKSARRALGLALVVLCAVASFLVARGRRRPFSPDAPDFRVLGPAAAQVVIVEFSDFQCPNCRYAEQPLKAMLKLYEGKVRFIFKQFPLRQHESAKLAAVAAECAGRQGKFWPFHDRLYDRQNEWPGEKADGFLSRYAKDLKLDLPAWDSCRASDDARESVERDVQDGENAWVGGTPTFFINGKRVMNRSLEGFKSVIDEELKKKS